MYLSPPLLEAMIVPVSLLQWPASHTTGVLHIALSDKEILVNLVSLHDTTEIYVLSGWGYLKFSKLNKLSIWPKILNSPLYIKNVK